MKTNIEVCRSAIDMNAEKIKGYPRSKFEAFLKALDAKSSAEVAIVTSNFKTVERINTEIGLLGKYTEE